MLGKDEQTMRRTQQLCDLRGTGGQGPEMPGAFFSPDYTELFVTWVWALEWGQ